MGSEVHFQVTELFFERILVCVHVCKGSQMCDRVSRFFKFLTSSSLALLIHYPGRVISCHQSHRAHGVPSFSLQLPEWTSACHSQPVASAGGERNIRRLGMGS